MRYKDFPKHDLRRCLAVLLTIEDLGPRASLHYAAQALECTRAEVLRAIELARKQLMVFIEKSGSVYKIVSWGFINRTEIDSVLRQSNQREQLWPELQEYKAMWTREREANLIEHVVEAVTVRRPPLSDKEADVYRLSAQLLKTRYRSAAEFLDSAARQFYAKTQVVPRPFPKVVVDGLVSDLPRLRNLLEKRMSGVHSW